MVANWKDLSEGACPLEHTPSCPFCLYKYVNNYINENFSVTFILSPIRVWRHHKADLPFIFFQHLCPIRVYCHSNLVWLKIVRDGAKHTRQRQTNFPNLKFLFPNLQSGYYETAYYYSLQSS